MKCPKCGKADPAELAGGEAFRRYQCRDVDCLEEWTAPKDRRETLREALEAHRTQSEEEERPMPKLSCGECGKTFVHQKRKDNHEAKCQGEKPARKAPKAAVGASGSLAEIAAALTAAEAAHAETATALETAKDAMRKALG